MKSINEVVREYHVTMTAEQVDPTAEDLKQWDRNASHWKVTVKTTLEGNTHQYTTAYHMGSAHIGEPQLDDVLNCLFLDSTSAENNPTFEDFANEYGYDEDSRSAERAYRACQKTASAIKRLFPDLDLFDVESL